ncbi:MAG: glycosyltransferase [bacterium]|nr:MAG: glycosyltransferase [bacterium]
MNPKRRLKFLLLLVVLLLVSLAGYKVYLYVAEKDYVALNETNLDRIEKRLDGRREFTFAVVGNIKNSNRIFERRLLPMIRTENPDFLISAGNAVYDGAEDKYRALYRGMSRLGLPYLLAFGRNEMEDFGARRFYRHFGPHYFTVPIGGAVFFFLDSTGETSWQWQMSWLERELAATRDAKHRFLVLYHSPLPVEGFPPWKSHDVLDEGARWALRRVLLGQNVSAVFSAGYPTYRRDVVDGVPYFISGCAGGLHLDEKEDSYQYLNIHVEQDGIVFENVEYPHQLHPLSYKVETVGLFLHSFFYVSLFNFLLVMGLLGLVALKIYSLILRQETYYRDFDMDEELDLGRPLRVAMFTDNYLPFVGGVPISIDRLYKGLLVQGCRVKIFAPSYPVPPEAREPDVFRCPSLFPPKGGRGPVTNIFSRKIAQAFREFDCDIVHVHHSLWLGRKGMWLGRRFGVPVVFTYHTRLERYIHYIPLPGTLFKSLGVHYLIKRFANNCQAIITPTTSTEEYMRNVGVSSLVETIPTGVDLNAYAARSPGEVERFRKRYAPEGSLLISVSRLAREKNLDFLMEGTRKVFAQSRDPIHCLLVGDGPERKRLEGKVGELGLSGRFHFAGQLDPSDTALAYMASDLFVFASTSETQGMVLVEAMAGGCPVVAVNASGVYDVVENGLNGYKVPESTDIWASTVDGLLRDGDRLKLLSENCRAYALKYAGDRIAAKTVNLYKRVLVLNRAARIPGKGVK